MLTKVPTRTTASASNFAVCAWNWKNTDVRAVGNPMLRGADYEKLRAIAFSGEPWFYG